MRMFRFPSWISESRGVEDAVHGVTEHHMAQAKFQPPRPLAVQAVGGGAKRKWDDDRDAVAAQQDQQPAIRRRKAGQMGTSSSTHRQAGEEAQQVIDHVDTKQESANIKEGVADTTESPVVPIGVMRDAIDSQLGLEILMRHKELLAIDQNLAKAQVALEQLRRCHLIPFPVAQGTLEAWMNVSAGTGPALPSRRGEAQPLWAAPYGVTDGPYSRHYARWLIPDPRFDGEFEREPERTKIGRSIVEGRTTRNSTDVLTPGAQARAQRGSMSQKLHALPTGYAQSKENAGPSILKRPDGQLVKLVCLDCRRENFGSTQGFINHCRIAHKREFKSHEEAAVQSGVAVELDDVGGIVGEEKAPLVATGLVHSLVTKATGDREAYVAVLSRINKSVNMYNQGKLPGFTAIPGQEPKPLSKYQMGEANPKFVPSSEVANLSRFLQAKAFNGNLHAMVTDAKKTFDEDEYSSHGEEDDREMSPMLGVQFAIDGSSDTPVPAMRIPARATMSATSLGRPGSSKGPESKNSRKPTSHQSGISPRLPYATPIQTAATGNHNRPNTHIVNNESSEDEADSDVPMLDTPSIHDLSPITITSNNAPSLVSDDDEYDEGDDDAESSIDGSDEEEEGSDVAEINFEDADGEDKVLPATGLRHRNTLPKEAKHVTFVSPVKERRGKGRTS